MIEPFEHQPTSNDDPIKKALTIDRKKHLLHTAIKWRAYVAENRMVTSSVIAKYAKVSSGRVRQILRLNNLDEALKDQILSMESSKSKQFYPESKLRKLIRGNGLKNQIPRKSDFF